MNKGASVRWFVPLLAAAAAVPAAACLPPPLPRLAGESDAAYAARSEAYQREAPQRARRLREQIQLKLWEQSPRLFVGRIERVRPAGPAFGKAVHSALVRPIRWIRGKGMDGPVWIDPVTAVCGYVGGGDAVRGAAGDLLVVFARPGPLNPHSIIDSVAARGALARPVVEALAAGAAGKPKA